MDESLRLSQEQKLQQRLTPLQVQFVKMLTMTGPEVEDEVRRAVDENPALEVCDSDTHSVNATDSDGEVFSESAEDMQLADYRTEDDIPSYRFEADNHSPDDNYYDPVVVSDDDNIFDSLSAQLSELELSDKQNAIARYIIGNLDDNGYLTRDLQAMCNDLVFQGGMEVSIDDMKEAFDKVRAFDPAGVGAVDLRDCLLLQLKRKKTSENVKLAIEIISDYFDLFSKMHYDKLCSLLNIGQQQLKEAIEEIRTLNPKPGSSISESLADERARHIIPDFSVDVDGGNITLTLLNNIPDLQIESTFAEDSEVTISSRQYDAMAFIKQKRDEAKGFMQVLKMRQETLYRVMSAIIKIQREFFLTEDESLIRPMILKDVKALTGYDMSVISRAVTGKYVTTARGVYPLKLFFNERPKDDDDTSFHEIQAVLKEIIDAEDKDKPLSDKAITEALTKRGYDIARRTVAKYRERMGFPVARLRKTI